MVEMPEQQMNASSASAFGDSKTEAYRSDQPNPIGPITRIFLVAVAIVPLALLAIAATLTPDPDGIGTHQQLGLPPCSFRVLIGKPCPACGMTTSWSHWVRGQWFSSIRANLGGFLLAFLSVFVALMAGRSVIRAESPSQDAQFRLAVILIIVVVVTLLNWLYTLMS